MLGTGAVVALLSVIFWLPWVYCQVVRGDYTVKWYHFFQGPLLWRRQPPADALTADSAIPDYYLGHHDDDVTPSTANADDVEVTGRADSQQDGSSQKGSDNAVPVAVMEKNGEHEQRADAPKKSLLATLEQKLSNPEAFKTMPNGRPHPPNYRKFDGQWIEPWNLYTIFRHNALPWAWYTVSSGLRTDVNKMQMYGSDKEVARLRGIHSHAAHYDNKVEHLFSFLQVLTACTASFAHGANDVSNAIGPLSVVYYVWSTQLFPGSSEATPIWILVLGAVGIVIGLGTYGWRLMSVLGNRLTLHSPSRGFSMEFGASVSWLAWWISCSCFTVTDPIPFFFPQITVVMASYLGLPVSTTQSITGATVAVSLCNGDWRSTNWKGVAWIFFSWVLTLPIAGIISGCLLGIILNAPRFGMVN